MAEIKVIINGQVADLPPKGLNLPLTYSLKDRNGLTINTGSRSEYAFELPATKNNDNIFQQFYDPAVFTLNQQVFLDASIEVDGIPFFIGRCQLQSADIRQDQYMWQGKSYKVAFYGNNADWATRIGDLLLKDLPYSDHTYSYIDNINNWYANYPAQDYKYIPLKLKDYTTFGQLDALEDSHPALFVAGLLDKIFNSIGYTLNSFFFTTDFFKRLILPIPILNRNITDEQYAKDYLNVSLSEPPTTNEYYTMGPPYLITPFLFTNFVNPLVGTPYNPATGFYTVPVTGYYYVRLTVNVVSTGTHRSWFNACYNNDPNNAVPNSAIFFGGIFAPYTGNASASIESDVVYLAAGTTISLGIANTEVPPGQNVTTWDFSMEIIGEAELSSGFQLNPKYVIDKSWKAIDLIKGLAHAFNLVFETNEGARKVQIEPADDFVLDERPALRQIEDGFYTPSREGEYLPLVDLSKGGEVRSDTKLLNQLRLKWKDDSNDPTVEALNLNENLGVMDARFNFSLNRYKEGETVLENPFFAPTLVIADNEIKEANSTKTPMIPFVWAVNYLETSLSAETVTQMLPRLLVSEDITIMTTADPNGLINVYDGVGVAPKPTPLNYMIDYNDGDGYQTSLSFGDETINGFPTAGLMKRFYLSELVRLKGGKYLEVYLFWDIMMINNLTFRHKIIINNNNYILQEINSFDVSKRKSTKTYLMLDYKEVGAENDIQSTTIQAKVNT